MLAPAAKPLAPKSWTSEPYLVHGGAFASNHGRLSLLLALHDRGEALKNSVAKPVPKHLIAEMDKASTRTRDAN